MPINDKPILLLVHGAWHGPWCWKYQTVELQALGYETETLKLPSTTGEPGATQFDDAAAVRSKLEALLDVGKRVVVVAHSYGGQVASPAIIGLSIPERAAEQRPGGVLGFVALCAYLLPGGLDQGALIKSIGGLPYVTWDEPREGVFVAKDPRSLFFPPDVSDELSEWAIAKFLPQSMAANQGIVPPQAWEQEGKYRGALGYIRCTGDCMVPIADQDDMITKAGGADKWKTRTLEGASHSPFLSRPGEVAKTVDELVQEFTSQAA
jgi:pimeloyl-ACP methyl ester carboxylesterase